ncbi:4-hydroxymandelate oxidase [Amycolatopsis bartoniae]|uniref:Alpha-hydroxy-acid oxidizing enzyme n=1 Tax=Amycolatopsis bartoniae TaxID=941986 RepID=A0A8H9J543_9PSEU|nr:alpha-hydroxy acid oxidase [Amycolatopsis bartoniae]MBB2937360.1 4-hydroxymandelate oxidase [Amycolatopsis bartoniae]TVT01606.1 alpha-hydroxy-acid oxidizing protein [Amycolatopsis bartoniae]GHF78433.1 alpha-hydroxy-acid oxidizing enzyme [Amycolatopsis bartoniae]
MISLAELHEVARQRLAPEHYDYFAGGAADEIALEDNEQAFRRLALLPRILPGSARRDVAVNLLGAWASMPVFVSPTAFHRLAHSDGELATARAVAAARTVLIASMAATTTIGDMAAAARAVDPDAALWFQLYLQSDTEVTDLLVRRATDAGCTALVVTVDSPVFGHHERDRRHGFTDLPEGLAAENMRDLPGGPRNIEMSPVLSWDDLERLRASTSLPLVLKGVLHPEDARLAVERGFDGILVSNHGGRQLDAVPASIDALPRIAEVVGGRVPVLLDGGVRRGTDVVIALALGATAVGIGRPVLWGLAADGESGVRQVLELLRGEFDHALALCGGRGLADLTKDLVTVRGPEVGKW